MLLQDTDSWLRTQVSEPRSYTGWNFFSVSVNRRETGFIDATLQSRVPTARSRGCAGHTAGMPRAPETATRLPCVTPTCATTVPSRSTVVTTNHSTAQVQSLTKCLSLCFIASMQMSCVSLQGWGAQWRIGHFHSYCFLSADQTTSLDEGVCELPREIGRCRAIIPRWFYNKDSNMCEEFNYGGCGGNDNNFNTQEECENRCQREKRLSMTPEPLLSEPKVLVQSQTFFLFEPVADTPAEDVCSLPYATGPCRAALPRWFFNKDTRSCEIFNYGGCRGNANNFHTEEDCTARCQGKKVKLVSI